MPNLGGKRQTTAMRGLCYSAQTSTAKGRPLNLLCAGAYENRFND